MKVIVFGVGNYYQEQKEKIKNFGNLDIVAFADNNALLWNEKVDGITVFPPNLIQTLEYEKVVIMSVHACAIYEQLLTLGVDKDRIIVWERLYRYQLQGRIRTFGTTGNDKAEKQKVLIISQELNYDGGSLAAIYAAMALKDRGVSVVLSAPDGNEKFISEATGKGVGIVLRPSLPYMFDEDKKWLVQFDIVLVNLFTMIESACEINKICPVLWWIHESSYIYGSVMERYVACLHMRTVSEMGICAVSSIAKRNFENKMLNTVKKILTVGIPDTANLISCKKNEDRKMIFAIIGTIHHLKAQDIFVKAASMLDDNNKAEFWLIGRYTDKDYFEKISKMASGINSIKILGELTREELGKTFPFVDVLVCASHEETLSITVIEAMMHGRACITTDTTGIAGYIEDGKNGFVIPADDADALAEKMHWMIENRGKVKTLGIAARKTYEEHFTMGVFGKNLEDALSETEREWNFNETSVHLHDL